MKRETIIRAWKDPEFRASLTTEERSAVPECPAGPAFTELDESELEDAIGGAFNYVSEDGCICSNYTGGLTSRFTTTRTTSVRFDTPALDVSAFNVKAF
ncbi:MAG: mersacidin/lichenicidin family type 2 lantibiotic [Hyalangium sp.]|uniref:mersacidin/lichenicidin family type 2 lantibiotic n=1 Tax=Hyalangium sp. TaxID=2028555 RepID=UPI00389A9B6D